MTLTRSSQNENVLQKLLLVLHIFVGNGLKYYEK